MNNQAENTVIEIIKAIQERIAFAETKIRVDLVESCNQNSLNSFWQRQVRYGQALMNEIQDRYFREEDS